ncbi:ferredoxin [Bacteroidia bacterium]|nr:ferredoxin [Bacteroidia bacterium]
MSQEVFFHHALKINKEACKGCMHCMKACPTQAIRMRGGVARLLPNRCVDCGECYNACPHRAVTIEHDDFDTIFKYEHRIALTSSVLFNQFDESISTKLIYDVIKDLGFTHIFEVEHLAGYLIDEQQKFADEHPNIRPIISNFCPAVVRLIQVRFPALVDNCIRLKPPVDIAAMYWRKLMEKKGIDNSKVGLFYITPCAAKIAAIKKPESEAYSLIDGVINMDIVYNRVLRTIKEKHLVSNSEYVQSSKLSSRASLFTTTSGEQRNIKGKSMAVDGINNVVEFLEKVENDELNDVDFLEMRVCDQSCTGGILVTGNRFMTSERMRKRAETIRQQELDNKRDKLEISDDIVQYLLDNMKLDKLIPRSMMKLDDDISVAIKKMSLIQELMKQLPGVDCGICGAPTCQALAEDIAKVEATMMNCVFWQTEMEEKGSMTSEERVSTFRKIWRKRELE